MSRPVTVAVAGAGYFAQFHYDGWVRIPEVHLVGAADLDAGKVAAVAARHGIERTFCDVAEMLDATAPDILDIAVPPHAHMPAIEAAAARGIDVICQKPFCATLADAQRATELAERAGITLLVHENFRFQPWYRKIRQLIDDGLVGTVYQVTFLMRPGDGQGPEAYLARQPYFQRMPRFLVHETGIHFIDVFRFLLGEMTSVYADLRKLNPVIAGEDSGTIIFEHASGARAVLDANRLIDHVADDHRLTMGVMLLEGDRGVIRLDGDGRLWHRAKGSREEAEIAYDWERRGFAGDCVFALQKAAIEVRLRGGTYENPARDYLANLRIEDAIYRSHQSGCRISPL